MLQQIIPPLLPSVIGLGTMCSKMDKNVKFDNLDNCREMTDLGIGYNKLF